jgi:chaperonin GroES
MGTRTEKRHAVRSVMFKPGPCTAAAQGHLRLVLALERADCQSSRALASPRYRRTYHMAFRPLGDRVLIRRVEEEAKTKGGIIIPDNAKEKPQEGEVVAAGPGGRDEDGKRIPMDVKAGDRILFGKWSGSEVKIDGEELLIMKESDILGLLDPVIVQAKAA